MDKKVYSLRIEDDLLYKIHKIAETNERSLNQQLLYLIKQCVKDYEKDYGIIEIQEEK